MKVLAYSWRMCLIVQWYTLLNLQSTEREEVSWQGEEQKCALPYPNCFIWYPVGYMDLVMWRNLLQITEFYEFKEDTEE